MTLSQYEAKIEKDTLGWDAVLYRDRAEIARDRCLTKIGARRRAKALFAATAGISVASTNGRRPGDLS